MRNFLLLLCFSLVSLSAVANPVDLATAKHLAANFANANKIPADETTVVNLTPEKRFTQLHILGFYGQKGFVILSADDRAMPILAYSLTSLFSSDSIPEQIEDWLKDYDDQIADIVNSHLEPTPEIRQQWTDLQDQTSAPVVADTIGPLLTTTWGQGRGYNFYCPAVNETLTLTGCVATATAQIMRYHRHPSSGVGSHSYTWNNTTLSANFENTTYDFDTMPGFLNSLCDSTEIKEVAKLIHHVGVAVEMGYGVSGSGAQTYGNPPSAEAALQQYFKYSNSIHRVHYEEVGDSIWKALLKNDLDSLRPVLYSGRYPAGGHAFVCDGYDTRDYFHFNWGWNGSCDGFYAIGALNPQGTSYQFNLRNVAVFGIKPLTAPVPAKTVVTTSVNNPAYGSVSGAGTYTSYKTIKLLASAKEGYVFDHWDDNSADNPLYSYAITSKFSRTAYFSTPRTDVLTYCGDYIDQSFRTGSTTHWGIRYPVTGLKSDRTLDTVQMYSTSAGTYYLLLYQGDGVDMTLVYRDTFYISSNQGWVNLPMKAHYPIDSTRTLWITLMRTISSGSEYPAACSSKFSGSTDCSKYRSGNTWRSLLNDGAHYYSWMIKGLTHEAPEPTTSEFVGSVSNDWSNPSNWNPQFVPNKSSNVVINANCSIPNGAKVEARSVTVNAPLVVMPNAILSADTLVSTVAANLILKADSTHQATILFAYGSPQATVESFFRGTIHPGIDGNEPEWQYRGFIGDNPTISNWNAVIFLWDETTNKTTCWSDGGKTPLYNRAGTLTMQPWVGYSIANYGSANANYSYSSTLIPTTTHTYNLTRTASGTGSSTSPNCGVNLITNSFSAPINMLSSDVSFSSDNVEKTFYFFNTRSFKAYNADSAASIVTYPVLSGKSLALSQYIPAGQSFAVRTNLGGETLGISSGALAKATSGRMYAPALDVNVLTISIDNGKAFDNVMLIENEACSPDFDNGYDGTKILQANAPQIFAANRFGRTAVNSDRTLLGCVIGVISTTDGEQCTLTFDLTRLADYNELYLYDRLLRRYVNMRENASYTFEARAGADCERFQIVGKRDEGTPFVASADRMLEVIGNRVLASGFDDLSSAIIITDIAGNIVWNDVLSNGPWFTLPADLPAGTYIIRCGNTTVKYLTR